ncbi:MAG: SpoIIIAH-like family protein [Clostridia bacterium]|nr:SpoIIIAH-like family protein [Clostridia bacterium]
MKKGKVFTKGQVVVGVMIIALAGAIWLNTKYLPTSTKYLGESTYVDNKTDGDTLQTSTKPNDYFSTAKSDREKVRKEALEEVEEILKSSKLSENEKKSALSSLEKITKNTANEVNIENLLKAKGFPQALAVISDEEINVIVKSDGLTTANTLQIQDIVTNQTKISLSKIKIIPIK